MISKSIVDRWNTREGAKAVERIHNLFIKKESNNLYEIAPFNSISGRTDLRGFPFREKYNLIKCSFENVDLSFATLQGTWIEECSFKNVIFEKTNLSDISDHGNNFSNCSFSGAKFIYAAIGYKGTEFNKCLFKKTDFKKTIFIRAEFKDCTFEECKLKGIDFSGSSFEECVFIGKLEDVWFRGGFDIPSHTQHFGKPKKNLMYNVSFAKASLWGVAFTNECDLSKIILPEKGKYKLYSSRKNRLEELKRKASDWTELEKKEIKIFADSYLVHAVTQDWMLLNLDEVNQEFGEVIGTKIIDTLDNYRE